jgi:hypothetical protein
MHNIPEKQASLSDYRMQVNLRTNTPFFRGVKTEDAG